MSAIRVQFLFVTLYCTIVVSIAHITVYCQALIHVLLLSPLRTCSNSFQALLPWMCIIKYIKVSQEPRQATFKLTGEAEGTYCNMLLH